MLLEPEVDFAAKLICDRKALQKLMDAVLNKKVIVTENYTCAENTSAHWGELGITFPGLQSSFFIIGHDAQKRRRFLGGDFFMVQLKDEFGNEKAAGNVKDKGDGSYLATYTVPADAEPGDYTLNVCLDGVHIHGSPFGVKVVWSDIFPSWTVFNWNILIRYTIRSSRLVSVVLNTRWIDSDSFPLDSDWYFDNLCGSYWPDLSITLHCRLRVKPWCY